MEKFNIIGELENLATLEDWHFLLGPNDYANIPELDMTDKGFVLWVDMNANPTRGNSGITNQIDYVGDIAILAKFDDLTDTTNVEKTASLDENIKQKFDRRLKDLAQLFDEKLQGFICSNRLSVVAESWQWVYNIFDTNFDGILCSTTLRQIDFE